MLHHALTHSNLPSISVEEGLLERSLQYSLKSKTRSQLCNVSTLNRDCMVFAVL